MHHHSPQPTAISLLHTVFADGRFLYADERIHQFTADAEKAVHLQIKYGAPVIKVLASGGVLSPLDSPTSEQVSIEELRVIVGPRTWRMSKWRRMRKTFAAFARRSRLGCIRLSMGRSSIKPAADFMKSHGIVMVPTVFVVEESMEADMKMHFLEYVITKVNALGRTHFPSFQLALHSGVTIAASSGHSYAPGTGTVTMR